jgi:hypothetical protein
VLRVNDVVEVVGSDFEMEAVIHHKFLQSGALQVKPLVNAVVSAREEGSSL